MALTGKMQRFAEEYALDLDGAQAYLRAGYKTSARVAETNAAKLLARADIQEAIAGVRHGSGKRGRPSIFSEEIATRIFVGLASGRSLRNICLEDDMPEKATVFRWLADDRFADFRDQYMRAREVQVETLVDEMLDIADDGSNDWQTRERDDGTEDEVLNHEHVQRSKIRLDTRKWIASKLMPKKYGEAAMVKLADADGEKLPMGDVERATRLAAIFAGIESRKGQDDAD
ncbi:hypothetical protein LH128_01182 [Sphingomonas sp. LH128]|uniref:terminase small subunit-like protein n=1 Tax=Sphingomonas sp. LH128 TaxID=473781 RepID=UPI00027CC204|nr:terminase small subunit [Sphingomonas sp. LH128]EJU14946.1 hypothetical protein LH128_01182 [Sphingomonas sp. LH128]